MKIIVARHAQTNYNLQMLCNADPKLPVHLTPTGQKQAENLANKLANYPIDKIYISEYPRTLQTANFVNKYHQLDLIADPRINENNTGYEGKTIQEWQSTLLKQNNWWQAKLNDGESLEEAFNRTEDFMNDLMNSDANCPLVVTHGFIIQCIYQILESKKIELNTNYLIEQGNFAEFNI
jgi:broad specificity phosphatase PhoE